MKIHLLNMGTKMYGDSILITHGNKKVLIDGAHPNDEESITGQLTHLLGKEPPFHLDLLVVTHCHSDHIGCLPALVDAGTITTTYALVADEKLGWGQTAADSLFDQSANFSDAQLTLLAASVEENYSALPDGELIELLDAVVKLRPAYLGMLKKLKADGTTIVRYGRDSTAKVKQIETALSSIGLKVLGPTTDHLLICAESLAGRSDSVATELFDELEPHSHDLADAYRQMIAGDSGIDAVDIPGQGAALNNQSIVLKVAAGGWSALLAGDMQFAKPEISGLEDYMPALRKTVAENGPYDFIKLTHHTSYNGLNANVYNEWSATKLFAHTGGSNDANHPNRSALELLESHSTNLKFARTDRNGIITISKNGSVVMIPSEGVLNDFKPNSLIDVPQMIPEIETGEANSPVEPVTRTVKASNDQFVEVITRVPHTSTTVTVTIQVQPGEKKKMT